MEEDNLPLGSRFADVVESAVTQVTNVPVIRQGIQFLGGAARFTDKNIVDPLRYASEQGKNSPEATIGTVIRGGEYLMEKAEEGSRRWAEILNVDPRITGVVGPAIVETALTAGTGKFVKPLTKADNLLPPGGMTPALATASGMAAPAQVVPQITKGGVVMKAVTATDPTTLAGVRGGVKTGEKLTTGSQGRRLIKRDLDIENYFQTIEIKNQEMKALRELRGDPKNLQKYIETASDDLQYYWKREKGNIDKIIQKLDGNKKNAQEGLSRAQSNVFPFDTTKQASEIGSSENVNYFRSKVGLKAKKAEESARAVKGYLEQHHLFPKGMSAAFFGKMDELISKGKATKDDLILMAEFTVNQGRRTGDVKANLINMAKDPHNELHTILRKQGAELKKSDYVQMLKDVDNVDDLLVQWRELLAGDAAYNIDTAKIWEPLDDLLKEIQNP